MQLLQQLQRVVKVEGKGVITMVCAAYHSSTSPACGSVTHCLPCAYLCGQHDPFLRQGDVCDPPPIDKAAALKAGNAKAPMMKMMKREPYKVDS